MVDMFFDQVKNALEYSEEHNLHLISITRDSSRHQYHAVFVPSPEKLNDEYEGLKDQVYNLTLYLHHMLEQVPDLQYYMNEQFSGMPGYNPDILKQ